MAVDLHALNLLRLAASSSEFGRTALIGRQGLAVSKTTIRNLLGLRNVSEFGPFCEKLLKDHFGSTTVDSYDYSDFEGATHLADLNEPLITPARYDTVIDCGSLEHIYNVSQALKNVSLLCDYGGQILHALPANNYCGHGFWQFSPELFFSLYSSANGYQGTRVFLAGTTNSVWYEVKPPQNGVRVDITSFTKLLVMVKTTKAAPSFCHENIQQSDYVHVWTGAPVVRKPRLSELLLGSPESERRSRLLGILEKLSLLSAARVAYNVAMAHTTLSRRNRHLVRRPIHALLAEQTRPVRTRATS